MTLSVCIATYRRPERLALLLTDLSSQEHLPDEIIVVDNDSAGSARAVVQAHLLNNNAAPVIYDIQPERNIAKTRNRTVELAHGEWLAFVDDDERAPPAWLRQLLEAAERFHADGVLAPVEPQIPPSAPAWLRRGKFYDWPHAATGTPVPTSMLRFGNVLLRGSIVRAEPGPFDPAYGLSTGEDGDLLMRLIAKGATIIWSDDALVREPIETQRLSLRWLLRRALSGGQHFANLSLSGRLGPVNAPTMAVMLARWLAQLAIAVLLAAATLPLGRHHAARWLIKAAANFGKLTAVSGRRFGEYANA